MKVEGGGMREEGLGEVQRTAYEVLIGVGCDGQCTAPWLVGPANNIFRL